MKMHFTNSFGLIAIRNLNTISGAASGWKHSATTHVWTVVDGGDTADQWILTGIHTVNRICYLVTEVAHNWQEIEFRIPSRGYSLTRLGLLRQTNKITGLMSACRRLA